MAFIPKKQKSCKKKKKHSRFLHIYIFAFILMRKGERNTLKVKFNDQLRDPTSFHLSLLERIPRDNKS